MSISSKREQGRLGDIVQKAQKWPSGQLLSYARLFEFRHATTSPGPSYSFSPWDSVRPGFNASATYASDRYSQTYFGVDSDNARRSGFSTYDAEGGMKDIGASVSATYLLTEQWAITGIVGVTQLVGDAADSPIVDDVGSATQGLFAAGLVYNF